MIDYDLTKPVRQVTPKEMYVPHNVPIIGNRKSHPEYTASDEHTLWGVYNSVLLSLQNERQWGDNTCRNYDTIVSDYLAPAFAGVAFAALDEDDFIVIWAKLKGEITNLEIRKKCCRLLRLIVDYGQRYGHTCTTLWGIPELQESVSDEMLGDVVLTSPELDDLAKQDSAEEEGRTLAQKGVRIGRAIPLAVEFRVARLLLAQIDRYGELNAALCMWLAGLRTSEATGLDFEHLVKINGCWGLAMHKTSKQHSRNTRDGGKTVNAPRIVPIPDFFGQYLFAKKTMIAQCFPDQDVNKYPLACCGVKYGMRCTAAEVNGRLKTIFRSAGVKESLVAAAYENMRDDPQTIEDCEACVVAYILRHQFGTACLYCGLDEHECSAVMGHALQGVGKSDFVNPDIFRRIKQKLDRRPIVVLLDKLPQWHQIDITNTPLDFMTEMQTEIKFTCDRHFDLTIFARNTNETVHLEIDDGISIDDSHLLYMPPQSMTNATDYITSALRRYADIYAQYYFADVDATEIVAACKSRAVMDDPALLYDLRTAPLSVRQTHRPDKPSDVWLNESEAKNLDSKRDAEIDAITPALLPSLLPSSPQKLTARSNHTVYAVDDTGGIHQVSPDAYTIRSRDGRGVKLIQDGESHRIRQVMAHDRNLPAYILTRDGNLHVLRPMIVLDGRDFGDCYCDVLADGGIFVQASHACGEQPTIVCMDNTGGVVRVKLPAKPTQPQAPVRLVLPAPGTYLAAACICEADEDILLVSAKGKALRLAAADLRAKKSYGVGMIQGMELGDDDRAVGCIPYCDEQPCLVTTEDGRIIHLAPLALRAHGRGSRGVALAGLCDGDAVASVAQAQPAALLATDGGYGLCVNVAGITQVGRGAKGVLGIKTGRSRLVGAVPLQLETDRR